MLLTRVKFSKKFQRTDMFDSLIVFLIFTNAIVNVKIYWVTIKNVTIDYYVKTDRNIQKHPKSYDVVVKKV